DCRLLPSNDDNPDIQSSQGNPGILSFHPRRGQQKQRCPAPSKPRQAHRSEDVSKRRARRLRSPTIRSWDKIRSRSTSTKPCLQGSSWNYFCSWKRNLPWLLPESKNFLL